MIRGLLVVCFLLGGEVFCMYHTLNRVDLENRALLTDVAARIDDLERQVQGAQAKADIPQTARGSSTYVHWGMKTCPNVTATTTLYSGQAAGSHYTHSGSGEYICLPNDPVYGAYNQISSSTRSMMYGAEYETYDNAPALTNLLNHDVPCSVCLARGKTTVMIPGRTSCYSGWTKEYEGYLMGAHYQHQGNGYVCMARSPESLAGSYADMNGALFYFVEGRCGTLQCPPYIEGAEIACVVCSTTK
ncbi:uncharacterized protein LOC127881968 [Dreissena polymorpha]|uniref:Short-chain collagen C4-like n=1 Tax=Dreissena polymorpha TaxID=45954 RepID=A0A9D4JZF6_DREPO|nr:uncharacterized protein LOC127881968 [Dreissena polymorpha]KAH3825843.1 hypothetical protein DPMN_127726 [Dreissena polymorpha]